MDHFYKRIDGWFTFSGVYADAVREAQDGAHFVEVGSWKGRSAAFMAVEIINSGKQIAFDCIDHWKGSQEKQHIEDKDVINGKLFEVFQRNIAPVASCINIRRMASIAAAATYGDGSLDFVFLDGSHDLDSVTNDLRAWLPKMKATGTIAGDDWNWGGVKRAVKAFFPRGAIEVLGADRGVHWRVRLPC